MNDTIRPHSGDYCKCGYCGYEGRMYGTPVFSPSGSGVSHPWCTQCGMNDKLTVIKTNKEIRNG